MNTYIIVIGIVQHQSKILLLKRTKERDTSPCKWQTVSGYIHEREAVETAVLREVKEETQLDGTIIRAGKLFEVEDSWGRWIILPFLIAVKSSRVKIDTKEHSEHQWVTLSDIEQFDGVAGLKQDFKSVGLL